MTYLSTICKISLSIVVCLSLSTPSAHAYDFDYTEHFETSDPWIPWTSDGAYTINFKGLTQDVPLFGNSYFKLDITLNTASYAYFQIPLSPIPSARGALHFSGKIYVKETSGHISASLGTNVSLAPAPTSGVNIIERITQPSSAWVTQTSDLIAASAGKSYSLSTYEATAKDTGFWTDRIGLYIFGSPGDRIVVNIDDLSIKGVVDDPEQYKKSTTEAWASHLVRMKSVISENQSKLDTLKNYLAKASQEKIQLLSGAESAFSEVLHNYKSTLKTSVQSLQKVRDYSEVLDGLREDDSTADELVTFPWPETQKMPDGPRPKGKSVGTLSVRAARGTFEAASFVLRATHRSISNVAIQPTDLVATGGAVIPASDIDIRVVKRWYQSGEGDVGQTRNKYLLSELLLKDESLIQVDTAAQTNTLRVKLPNSAKTHIDITAPTAVFPDEASIDDSKTLQPFNLVPHHNQQIWLTFHVPDDASPGFYKGSLNIRDSAGHVSSKVNLELTVLPFILSQPRIEYCIYYTSVLSKDNKPGFSSNKSSTQIAAELVNIRDHGIKYPTVYEPLANLEKRLTMMKSAGLPTDRLFEIGDSGFHLSFTPEAIYNFKPVAKSVMEIAAKNSFSNVYFYGADEAPLEVLAKERPFFELIHHAGAKVFAAIGGNGSTAESIAAVGGLLDTPVLAGPRTGPGDIAAWRSNGASRVFLYANPQVGVEDPEVYRKNFGLGLFAAGYDGAMNFAYQYPVGAAWNDFDNPRQAANYRDLMFTYPISDGVIDTIQWEGFREGVDDTRYLATLLDLDPKRTETGTRTWIASLFDANKDVVEIRELIIDEILKVLANKTAAKPVRQ